MSIATQELGLRLVNILLQTHPDIMPFFKQSHFASFCCSILALSATAFFPNVAANAENCSQSKAASTVMAKTQAAASTATIVEVASSNDSFKTLVEAVKAADLVETLSGKGPFTVFAPTDKAFKALPKGTLESLLKPENKSKLQKILTYHVVSGEVTSNQIRPGQVKTVEGSPVTVSIKDGKVMVGSAKVTSADIDASNGVIHVIDQVLLPPNP
ncbi:MAG: fasciclin domain-containing protein [Snowella sp.]|nr:fasciclin domain-containing protein [Snowella sp.]